MSAAARVLCVLSDQQRQEYRQDLFRLEDRGAELIHVSSADRALSAVGDIHPDLVLIGMEIGPVEGLELMALLLKKYPEFDKPLVVLPDAGDGMPPMIHQRVVGQKSPNVESAPFGQVVALLEERDKGGRARAKKWFIPGIAAAVLAAVVGTWATMRATEDEQPPHNPPAVAATGAAADHAGMAVQPHHTNNTVVAPTAQPAPQALPHARPPAPHTNNTVIAPTAQPSPPRPAHRSPRPGIYADLEDESGLPLPMEFAIGQWEPQISDPKALDTLITVFKGNDKTIIEITGHTSHEGEENFNVRLGLARAQTAMKYLVRRGIPKRRIMINSLGETAPVAPGDTAEGRRKNRRVTVRFAN